MTGMRQNDANVHDMIDAREQHLFRSLDADGDYRRVQAGKDAFSAHTFFMTNPSLSGRGSALKKAKKAPRLVLKKP